MLWAYSIIAAISPPDLDVIYKNVTVGNTSFLEETFTPTKSLGCKPFINNKYSPVHSCDMATEALYLGLISLSLTLLNILCIFIMGITFLKVNNYLKKSHNNPPQYPVYVHLWNHLHLGNSLKKLSQSYLLQKHV